MNHLGYANNIGKDGVSPDPVECSTQAYGSLAVLVTSDV